MTDQDNDDEIHAQAAEWFVRLQNSEEEQDWLAHRDWLEADARHVQAFSDVEALWVDLEPLATSDVRSAASAESLRSTGEVIDLASRRVTRWRRLAWIPAAAAAAVAALIFIPQVGTLSPGHGQTYRTGTSETRQIALADGSRLTLNRASEVTVRLDAHDRVADLKTGEVSFDIHHETDRPFRVAAADREIRVLGTEFNVVNQSGAFSVTVRRGLVSVSPHDQAGSTQRVPAGRALIHLAGASDIITPIRPDDAFAWQIGLLVYTDRPLTEVASDLSRYMGKRIRVSPALQEKRLTGVFDLRDTSTLRHQFELALPVRFKDDASGGEELVENH